MKEIQVIKSKESTNIKAIKKFTDSVGLILPKEYISFWLKHNGGYPINSSVDLIEPVDEIEEVVDIRGFLALYDGEHYNIEDYYETYKNRVPKELIPIISSPGSNLICLCVKGINYGKVYYWDHDWESELGEEPTYDNIYLVANSFTDFINRLYKFDLDEDENGKDIYISTHDKYSLPTSSHIKKHGEVITDFFSKAPKNINEFIIKEFTATGDLLLSFKTDKKEYFRRINKDGKIIEES